MKWAAHCENTINSRSQDWHCVIVTGYCVLLSTSDSLSVVHMYSITVLNLLLFCLCAAAWSWTLKCRKINSSLWWRDCVPQTSPRSPLYRILRRPSAPRPNASPKRRPRNTRAGNSGLCDRRITHNWPSFPVQEFSDRASLQEHLFTWFAFWAGQIRKILSDCFLLIYLFGPFGTLWTRVLN